MNFTWEDPRAVVRGLLGGAVAIATVILVIVSIAAGRVDWTLAGFVGLLWVFWSAFNDVVRVFVEPVTRRIMGVAVGGVADGVPLISIDEETGYLERLLGNTGLPPHRRILIAVRLAEIYRTHQHDQAKSDALLARLRAEYPDAPELGLGAPSTPGA
ncbi:MAG TPA: hypothetical protein VI160_07035 [Gemmatimonadales bacterium]